MNSLVWKVSVFWCFGICLLTAAYAAAPKSYIIFQLDNDLFTGSDNDYTNGARLAYMQRIPPGSLNKVQNALKSMTGVDRHRVFGKFRSLIESESTRYDFGLGLSQFIFTPDDPNALFAGPGKRPYAGWLGAEISLHAKNEKALSSVVVALGVTGKHSYARSTQNWVHTHISDSPLFQGWDSQIPEEVTLNLIFDRKRRLSALAKATKDWEVQMDGYVEWGAMLGNGISAAHVGTTLRIGLNLPVQYMAPRLQFGNFPHELFLSNSKYLSNWSVYGFGGVRANGVLYNITLDGPLFTEFQTGTASEPFFGEVVVGFGVRYEKTTIAYSRTFRSQEFKGQEYNHQFGSFLISMGF